MGATELSKGLGGASSCGEMLLLWAALSAGLHMGGTKIPELSSRSFEQLTDIAVFHCKKKKKDKKEKKKIKLSLFLAEKTNCKNFAFRRFINAYEPHGSV